MGWLSTLFGGEENKDLDPDFSPSLHKIEQVLSSFPEPEAKYLACVALLTARIANIDHEISEGEKARIQEVLGDRLKLPEAQAAAIMHIALHSEQSATIEHHIVTRRLNELSSREQKISLLHLLFHVAAADDITEQEGDQIGAISNALMLPRSDFLEVRAEFREHRKIFKGTIKK